MNFAADPVADIISIEATIKELQRKTANTIVSIPFCVNDGGDDPEVILDVECEPGGHGSSKGRVLRPGRDPAREAGGPEDQAPGHRALKRDRPAVHQCLQSLRRPAVSSRTAPLL